MFEQVQQIKPTGYQREAINCPLDAKVFLEGPVGCGKTATAVERMLHLMTRGIPGDSILLLLPQRTLGVPYQQALNHPGVIAGGMVQTLTLGGLAQRMVDLFWPLIGENAGFAQPGRMPTFLTLETAQYFMAHLIRPLLDEGYFQSVTIERNRLYSQILDNLNKSAIVGFPFTEIGERLKSAWIGEAGQLSVYDDTQACASIFRKYCLEHNLLDFSLQVEVFIKHLWPDPICRNYLNSRYQHLIVDNLEEDTPVTHDMLLEWLPDFSSAFFVFDQGGGYRRFLGADPDSAYRLKPFCPDKLIYDQSFVTSREIIFLGERLGAELEPGRQVTNKKPSGERTSGIKLPLYYRYHRYYPQMLDWVVDEIEKLIRELDVPASEIVVLAPYLSDALRFSLITRLDNRGIPARSHRPSRSLREEPITHCLLTFASLAYPEWGYRPTKFDLAYALIQAIEGMDLVRAQLLADIVYRVRENVVRLSSFELIKADTQARITYLLGEKYEILRAWLAKRHEPPDELDHFLSRLFGEVLSQPGFGFHNDLRSGEITANLIESIQKFRWVVGPVLQAEGIPLGKEYIRMVQDGVIAAQYLRSWQVQPDNGVFIVPAYTFLLSNRPASVQFWLDVGSSGWAERLEQPLTHPYVLRRGWLQDRPWSDADELETGQMVLQTLTMGLIHRCRRSVFLGLSELGEQGFEQRGALLQALQRVLIGVNLDES